MAATIAMNAGGCVVDSTESTTDTGSPLTVVWPMEPSSSSGSPRVKSRGLSLTKLFVGRRGDARIIGPRRPVRILPGSGSGYVGGFVPPARRVDGHGAARTRRDATFDARVHGTCVHHAAEDELRGTVTAKHEALSSFSRTSRVSTRDEEVAWNREVCEAHGVELEVGVHRHPRW